MQIMLSCYWIGSLIARSMGPTWGPPVADRTQVGPMLAPWTLISGMAWLMFMIIIIDSLYPIAFSHNIISEDMVHSHYLIQWWHTYSIWYIICAGFWCDLFSCDCIFSSLGYIPKSKVHGANMGPIWGRQDPDGRYVGPMNFAIWDGLAQVHDNHHWFIVFHSLFSLYHFMRI